ncbi:MAG: glycerol-3-phosphate dehydrogenase/oxidase [Acidimicrobiia bacterium]
MTGRSAAFERTANLGRLAGESFDVLVVGGGITGAGTALDAASRGLRTALVERADFASGTSSRSSKLVHGGLRYLQQGDFRLVYQALHERQRLCHNAAHLVRIVPFLIPLFTQDGLVPPPVARALGSAMWMYDLTGGARVGKLHQRLSTARAVEQLPTLPAERIAGAYLYYDAQADDARLTLTVARTAADGYDAVVANGVAVTGFDKSGDGQIVGARLRTAEGEELAVRARAIVNATGVWTDDVRALDEGTHPGTLRPAKGTHVTVPWAMVRNRVAAVLPAAGGRSVFVVPWGDHTYIGTTDTDYDGPLDDPRCTHDDVAYLLGSVNAALTTSITEADVVGTWAGLRPLVRSSGGGRTADLSRRHLVVTSPGGVVTVAGGKLTTYRAMAAQTVDAVLGVVGRRREGRTIGGSVTRRLPLLGAAGFAATVASANGDETLAHLAERYGDGARSVLSLADGPDGDPSLRRPLVPGLPYLRAEAVYGARFEMALTVDDVLARRTRARVLARDASVAVASEVAALIGPELGWDEAEQARQAEAYRRSVALEGDAPGRPETAAVTMPRPA